MDARWGEGRGRRARRGINCTAVPLRATNQCSVVETARGRGKARASGAAGARARPGREERDEETSEDVSARRWSAFAPRVGSRARGYGRSLAPAGDIVVESRTHRGEDGGGSEAGEGGLAELLDLLDDGGLGGGGLDGLTVTSGGEGKVVVSSRSGYPMRVMSGLLCIRGIPTRRTPNRSRSETRASVRVARDFALKRRAAIRRARRLVLARVPRRIARRATSPSLARTPSGPSKHRIAAPSASRKPKFPDGVCRPYSPLVGADRGGARDDGGGGDASHLSCWS